MLFQDIPIRFRNLARSKGFATVAILCLGFGVGLNATIFSLIDGVLLKPYPYTDPDRILVVGEQRSADGHDRAVVSRHARLERSELHFFDYCRGQRAQPDGRGRQRRAGTLSRRRRLVGSVSDAWHPSNSRARLQRATTIARVPPTSCCSDMTSGRTGMADGDDVIGRAILVNSKPHVVVGVMPQGFAFPNNQKLWVPLSRWSRRISRTSAACSPSAD